MLLQSVCAAPSGLSPRRLIGNDSSARLVSDPVTYLQQLEIEWRRIKSQHFAQCQRFSGLSTPDFPMKRQQELRLELPCGFEHLVIKLGCDLGHTYGVHLEI